MELDHFAKIIALCLSASIGLTFGILRSKIFSSKHTNYLHYFFIIFSVILFSASVYGLFEFWSELSEGVKNSDSEEYSANCFANFVLWTALFFSLILLYVTTKFLHFKNIHKTSELDPLVNNFTSNADRNEIKLFGGDLNFFGESPNDMNENIQYRYLRSREFNKVLILCESPNDITKKRRYGKILSDNRGSELRFYNPDNADLRVRGRIIQVNGANKLLIYKKIKSKTYQAIETDTADSDGALYNNIWDLVWSLATIPSPNEEQEYKSLF